MKLLLLGKSGQVGWELQRALAPLGEVTALGRDAADFNRTELLGPLVAAEQPDVIVNAAADTGVDQAEADPDRAMRVNGTAVGELAEAAAHTGALLVHYSTDYVFGEDGTDQPHAETDPTGPLSVYGKTKRAGELAIEQSGCTALVLRTSWVYAARGRNFVRTILRLAGERSELKIVSDQVGAPTGAELIADVTALAIAKVRAGQAAPGLYHLAAAGSTTWFDFARHIARRAGEFRAPLSCPVDAIRPLTTAEYGARAPRPLNSRLDTSKLRTAFEVRLPAWEQGVDRTLAELLGS